MKKYKKTWFVLVGLIILYNLSWLGVYYLKYDPYTEDIPKTENGKYILKDNGYHFSVKKPSYLSFTGNLAVTNNKDDLSLIVWPLLTGGYEYGLQILGPDNTYYSVMIDNKLNYLDEKDIEPVDKDRINELLKENKSEIKKIMSEAKRVWGM